MILRYDIRKMQELLQSFYQLTQIRIVIFNDAFQKITEAPGYDSAFCHLIRVNPEAEKNCQASDQYACEQCRATDNPYIYICHAGLMEVVAPVRYGNLVIGYLMFGQILQHSNPIEYWQKIKHLCNKYCIDEEALYAAYSQQKSVDLEQVLAARKILEACATYLYLERTISLKEDSLPTQIDEYITKNLNVDLSVEALCSRFRISRSRLYKIMREYYGCGIEITTRRLRIKEAKSLLEKTSLPVSELSYIVGYQDHNYFIKVFKKETGQTPLQYRKNTNKSNTERIHAELFQ